MDSRMVDFGSLGAAVHNAGCRPTGQPASQATSGTGGSQTCGSSACNRNTRHGTCGE